MGELPGLRAEGKIELLKVAINLPGEAVSQ